MDDLEYDQGAEEGGEKHGIEEPSERIERRRNRRSGSVAFFRSHCLLALSHLHITLNTVIRAAEQGREGGERRAFANA